MRKHSVRLSLVLALVALLSFVGISHTAYAAGSVIVEDGANVLNRSNIQSAVSGAPFNVIAITSNNASSKSAFDSTIDSRARNNNDAVVIGVDTTLKHAHVAANNAYIHSADANAAQNAATARFGSGDWTGGFTAAISQLRSAAVANGSGRSNNNTSPITNTGTAQTASGGFPWPLLCVGLLVIGGIALFMGRSRMSRGFNQQVPQQPFINQGPGYPQQGYGPGYNQGYGNQGGGGMGPLGGGIIGAAGGGFLGYELGKAAGEREAGNNGGFVNGNNSGNFGSDPGGFVSSDSNSGDFGGNSGSGDFGGGSSFDSNFGGGGGGGDFSSSSGGDFGGGGGGGGGGFNHPLSRNLRS